MPKIRGIAMALLIAGVALLAYGGWEYFDSRSEVRVGDARFVIEEAELTPAVWAGGALILASVLMVGASMLFKKEKV